MPALDAEMREWIDAREQDPTAADTSIPGMRAHTRAESEQIAALAGEPSPPIVPSEETLETAHGPLAVRVYQPLTATPLPTIVCFHGGGWILGDLDTHDLQAKWLSAWAQMTVVTISYRLAPEHRFPAAFDDCLAATVAAAGEIGRFGDDPGAIVVAGDSAGGQLAASVAIACRDEGVPLAAQLLIVPAIDLRGGYADETGGRYPSRLENATGYGLTLEEMQRFAREYQAAADWRASPIDADDLTGVAPAIVHVADLDPLRDEGEAYARRLREAGVAVTLRRWPSLAHAYARLPWISDAATRAARQGAQDLQELLGGFPDGG